MDNSALQSLPDSLRERSLKTSEGREKLFERRSKDLKTKDFFEPDEMAEIVRAEFEERLAKALAGRKPFEKTAKGASPSAGQSGRTSMEAQRASANGETARDGRPTWTARFRSRQTRTDLRVHQTAGETGCRCERR